VIPELAYNYLKNHAILELLIPSKYYLFLTIILSKQPNQM